MCHHSNHHEDHLLYIPRTVRVLLCLAVFGTRRLYSYLSWLLNTLRPKQNGRYCPDDVFKCILLNENNRISIKISVKSVSEGPISNSPALVQIMAWGRSGDKPLSEPMIASLLTHICVTGTQWVNGHWSNHVIAPYHYQTVNGNWQNILWSICLLLCSRFSFSVQEGLSCFCHYWGFPLEV